MTASKIVVIAAIARNGVIGRGPDIPWHLPTDLRRFRTTTLGHTVVFGRRTYESIGHPLPGRRIVVLSSQESIPGVDVVPTLSQAIDTCDGMLFIAGGSGVYAEGLEVADEMHLTRVEASPEGDVLFPEVDMRSWWRVYSEPFEGGRFERYVRASPAPHTAGV